MPVTYLDIESRAVDAILELDKCENPMVAMVAQQFNILIKKLINE